MLWSEVLSRDVLGYGGLFVGGVGAVGVGLEMVG